MDERKTRGRSAAGVTLETPQYQAVAARSGFERGSAVIVLWEVWRGRLAEQGSPREARHSARPSPPPAGRRSGLRGRRVVGAAAPTAAGFKAARSVASLGAGVQLPLPSGPLRTRRQTQRPQEVLRLCRAMGEFYMNHLIESSPAVDRDLKKSTDRCRSQGSEMGELG